MDIKKRAEVAAKDAYIEAHGLAADNPFLGPMHKNGLDGDAIKSIPEFLTTENTSLDAIIQNGEALNYIPEPEEAQGIKEIETAILEFTESKEGQRFKLITPDVTDVPSDESLLSMKLKLKLALEEAIAEAVKREENEGKQVAPITPKF